MMNDPIHEIIFELIREERKFQDNKWGNRHNSDMRWCLIALEELGEVSKDIIEGNHHKLADKEIIQVAAVCVAWLKQRVEKRNG